MPPLDDVELEHQRVAIDTTGVSQPLHLHVVTAGPRDGTPVILLHGFPDSWYGWRRQIPALAAAGYRVIVPDQRGYAGSDKPRGVRAYDRRHLARDVVGLQDALLDGAASHVVGHDWGGGVAWSMAARHPERVRTLTVLNCPRPEVLRACIWSDWRQVSKSWYIVLFQVPWWPERWLAGGAARRGLVGSMPEGTLTDDELDRMAEVADLDSMRAALGWYRAAPWARGEHRTITAPTVLIWGADDVMLRERLAEPSLSVCTDARMERIEGGTHWPHLTRPDQVNRLILDQLQACGGPDPYVYKIATEQAWDAAPDPWPGSPDDLRDGFVHFSAASQVDGTLQKHFAGQTGLTVLTVDPG